MGKIYYNKMKYFIFRRELTVFSDFQFFWDECARIESSFEGNNKHGVEALICGLCVRAKHAESVFCHCRDAHYV